MESSPVIFIQEFEIKRGGNNPAMNDCLPPDFLPLFQAFGHIESMKELSDENVHTFQRYFPRDDHSSKSSTPL